MSNIQEKILRQIYIVSLMLLLLLFVLPLLLLASTFLLIIRYTVFVSARMFKPSLQNFVGSQGRLFEVDDFPSKSGSNVLLTLFWGPPSELHSRYPSDTIGGEIQKIRAIFQRRVLDKKDKRGSLVYPELRQYWTQYLNYTFWTHDKTFSVRNHIRLYDYDLNTRLPNEFCNENHLRSIISELTAQPWKPCQSPWEILIIENYKSTAQQWREESLNLSNKSQGQTVWILRYHHGMGDPYSFYRILARDLFQMEAKDFTLQVRFKYLEPREKVLYALAFPFRMTYDVAASLVESFDGSNPWRLKTAKMCREYNTAFSTNPVAVERVKWIKTKFGVSYKAVLVHVTARAIARLMREARQTLPKNFSAVSHYPYLDEGRPEGVSNYFAPIFHKLPVRTSRPITTTVHDAENVGEPNPLLPTFKSIDKSKYFTAPLFTVYLMKLLLLAPDCVNRHLLSTLKCTINMNCFQGPEVAPYFLGSQLDFAMLATGCTHAKLGASIMFLCMGGKQGFCATIDKTVFSSQELFSNFDKYIEQELNELERV